MTKSEAGKKGGLVRSACKHAAVTRNLAAARLAQARKLLGIEPAPVQPRLLLLPTRKDANANPEKN